MTFTVILITIIFIITNSAFKITNIKFTKFWNSIRTAYSFLSKKALRVLIPFFYFIFLLRCIAIIDKNHCRKGKKNETSM